MTQGSGGDAETPLSLSPLKVSRLAGLSLPGTGTGTSNGASTGRSTARGGSISGSSHYHSTTAYSSGSASSNSNSNSSYQANGANNGSSTPFSTSSAPTPVMPGQRGFERKASVNGIAGTPKERMRDPGSADCVFALKRLEKMSEQTLQSRKLDILVVDDCEADCAALSDILRSEGHNCFCSYDGIDAIEKFLIVEGLNEKHSAGRGHHLAFDVVIVDFVMPGMDGPQCVRRMRDMGFKGLALGMVNAPASEV